MKTDLHPVEALALALVAVAWAAFTIARAVLVPLVALLLVACGAGRSPRPAAPSPAPAAPWAPRLAKKALFGKADPAPAAPWAPPTLPALEPLPVATLRRLAREAGLPRCLGRSGRREDLLVALAVAW